jgi:predicted RNA-binding Zn-ribbon protein involved in translation (DUF1610 family)
MAETEVIDCPHCNVKVKTEIQGSCEEFGDDLFDSLKYSLFKCPDCGTVIIGRHTMDYDQEANEPYYTHPKRIWPNPDRTFSEMIPIIIRMSLEEAKKCLKSQAHMACVVMCGRALEGLGKEFDIKSSFTLAEILVELKNKKVIDDRIFRWGDELRKHRNLAAHPSIEEISKEDAEDCFDFILAICEYVFVLEQKFKNFMDRKARISQLKSLSTPIKEETNES